MNRSAPEQGYDFGNKRQYRRKVVAVSRNDLLEFAVKEAGKSGVSLEDYTAEQHKLAKLCAL